jgi:hypothetical protein
VAAAWYAFRPELLLFDRAVSEGLPDATLTALAAGQFQGYAHETEGTATLYDGGGKTVLRLTNFKTSNGPDVRIYLVAAPDATDDATVKNAEVVDLGSMKGNVGDQNYDVPATVDLSKFQAVVIWCARFSVNFGAAPLRRS